MAVDPAPAAGKAAPVTAHVLWGSEPSFYTRKAWVAMRLLGLEVNDRLKSLAVREEVEAFAGGYRRFPVVRTPEGGCLVDSTAIVIALSARQPARTLVPEDPALGLLVRLADEWIDEWLLRAALVHRALDPGTRAHAADQGARNLLGLRAADAVPPELAARHARLAEAVAGFFIEAAAANGIAEANREAAMHLFARTLAALAAAVPQDGFLFGTRPSLADAALWGFLDAGFLREPAPAARVAAEAPGLVAFHARLRAAADAGGTGGLWLGLEEAAARLAPILACDALGFAAFLGANRLALATGARRLVLDGLAVPARGFVEKGRLALRAALMALDPEPRAAIEGLGWPLLAAVMEEGADG